MESGKDEVASSESVCVQVSTNNCLKDINKKIKSSVEDKNKNITHCSNIILTDKKEFDGSSKHVSYKGPNGMVNGVDVDKYDVQFCDTPQSNFNVKKSSSPCGKCKSDEGVSDFKCEKIDADNRDVKFALDCKKALQELILDTSQECCQSKASECSIAANSHCSNTVESVSNSSNISERLVDSQSTLPEKSTSAGSNTTCERTDSDIEYVSYENEHQMPDIMRLIQKDLSEPYSIYTYRYFIHKWPQLCFLAMDKSKCVGAIVCKLDIHRKVIRRGYIAMLAVDEKYRKRKIGTNLVLKAIRAMVADNADEIVLETEITNNSALCLYENLGFVRDKRLFRYYLNGVDALRLKLWLR